VRRSLIAADGEPVTTADFLIRHGGRRGLTGNPRPQLRNAHRIGSRIIEQRGVYRGRPTWIANVNEPDSVIPAEVCELDGGDGETV